MGRADPERRLYVGNRMYFKNTITGRTTVYEEDEAEGARGAP